MKTFASVLTVALAVVSAGCIYVSDHSTWRESNFSAVTNITQTGEIAGDIKTLEVDNHFGSVRITGTTNNAGQWTWNLTVRAPSDSLAQQGAEEARCEAERDGDRLRLVVSFPQSNGRRSFQSDLEIQAPESVSVRTKNAFGKTEVSGIAGDVEATGQSGSITLRHIKGAVRARTSFASLRVNDCGPARLNGQSGAIEASEIHGALDAETSFAPLSANDIDGPVKLRDQSGSIDVARTKGDADVKTSFASLTARNIGGDAALQNQSGRVEASDVAGSIRAYTSFSSMNIAGAGRSFICHNQSGSVHLRATSPALTNVEVKTSFAAIEVGLPRGLSPTIQARTSFGAIESDFPILMKPQGEDPFADVAADTPRISLENQSGSIRVRRE